MDWAEYYRDQLRAYGARPAKPSDWKTRPPPPPHQRADLGYTASYTEAEYQALAHGFKPSDMDQRWFIALDTGVAEGEKGGEGESEREGEGWLNIHRSWTGVHVYALHLARDPKGGWMVDKSWVSINQEEYDPAFSDRESWLESDRQTVKSIIDTFCFQQWKKWLELKAKDEAARVEGSKGETAGKAAGKGASARERAQQSGPKSSARAAGDKCLLM